MATRGRNWSSFWRIISENTGRRTITALRIQALRRDKKTQGHGRLAEALMAGCCLVNLISSANNSRPNHRMFTAIVSTALGTLTSVFWTHTTTPEIVGIRDELVRHTKNALLKLQ